MNPANILSTPLIVFTKPYQIVPGQATIPNEPMVLHVSAPTKCYQTLPCLRSGLTPAMRRLYQPRLRQKAYHTVDWTMCYVGLELMVCGAVDECDAMLTFVG